MMKIQLPGFAYQEEGRTPADFRASFLGEDGDTLTVDLEKGEADEGQPPVYLTFSRSGFQESRFSRVELAKALEVAQALLAARPAVTEGRA